VTSLGRDTLAAAQRPAARAAAVFLTLAEAAALLALAVWWITGLRVAGIRGAEVFLIAFAIGVAAVLAASARALARRRRAARGPIVTWQVLQAVTAATLLGVPQARAWAGLALGWSAALVVLLMIPGVSGDRPAPPERG
jgi:hypothetical protein